MLIENGSPIRSVSRSISVLRTINAHGSLSMMDIARYEALPYPTAFRIVQTLVHEGLIERERERKHYRPTALVQSLASGYVQTTMRELAQPHLSALTREVGWPIFLSARVGTRMVVRTSTHHETTLTFDLCEPGTTIPLISSATGHVWLAALPEDHVRDLVRWGVGPEGVGALAVDIDALFETLSKVRALGYAARPCMNNRPNRTASIAVPAFRDGRIEAVLTLTYFATAMKDNTALERYVEPMLKAAEAVTAALTAR